MKYRLHRPLCFEIIALRYTTGAINGLMLIVHNEFGMNPTDGAYYVFSNRARDRLKVLHWDKTRGNRPEHYSVFA